MAKNLFFNGDFVLGPTSSGTVASGVTDGSAVPGLFLTHAELNGSALLAYSRQTFTPGQTDVPKGIYYLRLQPNTSLPNPPVQFDLSYASFRANKGTRRFVGKYMTLSFYARAESPGVIGVNVLQSFGTGGSNDVNITDALTVFLGTSWARYTVTFLCPSVSSKTFGTTDDYLAAQFYVNDGHGLSARWNGAKLSLQRMGFVDIANVQLEEGAQATDFETNLDSLGVPGTIFVDRIILGQEAITYAASIALDFDSKAWRTISLTGNLTFANASNKGVGKELSVKLLSDGSTRTLTFPASWVFVGAKPANIAATKTGVLTLRCFGPSESDVVAQYAVEA
jgi:hypothetical protein